MKIETLPAPPHYDANNCKDVDYSVADVFQLQKEAGSWQRVHDIKPVGSDKMRVHMLVIDDQFDFSFPEGSLYVAGASGTGAMDAHRKLVEFTYRYLGIVSAFTCTMDTHLPYQVFFPSAHLKEDGTHPEPNTVISADAYRNGEYRPNPVMAKQIGVDPVWLQKQFVHYCAELEKIGKNQLYLWPYHCMLGSKGHRLSGVVEEARLFHSFVRGAENRPEIKGGNPLSERYSIFKEEVTTCWDGRPIPGAQKNTALIKTLLEADVVILAGLASSHCVKESIEDFLGDIQAHDPELAKKVYILKDCTAPVVIPGVVDFTADADAAFAKFQSAGMHIVRSTQPIEDWPEIQLG
jgi:nicotinamidase-related amidase